MNDIARLCYIKSGWAYFTTQPLNKQWGDDWDDAPYEYNAGPPYDYRAGNSTLPRWKVFRISFEGPFITPDIGYNNSPWSVRDINAGAVAWLRFRGKESEQIFAGTSYEEFRAWVLSREGKIFEKTMCAAHKS